VNGSQAVAVLESASLAARGGRFSIDPALLDGCLQTLLATLGPADPDTAHVPVAIGRLRLHGLPLTGSPLTVRADRRDEPGLVGDLTAWAEDGRSCCGPNAWPSNRWRRGCSPRYWCSAGRRLSRPVARATSGPPAGSCWETPAASPPKSSPRSRVPAFPPRRIVDPATADVLGFDDGGGAGSDAVLDLRALDGLAGADDDPDAIDDAGIEGAIELIRATIASESRARLWLVTRGTQRTGAVDEVTAPAAAALWGLGAVANSEHPGLRLACVDLDPARRRMPRRSSVCC
jgi:hypothetical protein